ncbi:MAG: cation:proton antiporter [Chitinophagales bacterium]|nr:cation:proton antiporter [Chitinophagales bacterium]
MEFYRVIILLLAIAIGLYPIATKFKKPYPILLLVVGIGVGFFPHFENIDINPEIIFLIFLPPFLYDAAYNISFKEFKRNISVISTLAFALVFITTSVIAIAVHFILGLDWALSFILGAILSPPDAIAATGVTKNLHLPHRTNTILEGESLINDASALVALKFAMAAVAGSQFIFWKAGLVFFTTLLGGAALGWILARFFVFIAKKLTDKDVIVSLNLLLPFALYILSEELSVSGVIAVVMYGLTISQNKNKLPEKSIAQSKSVLDTTVFILSGLIFILIGLEFPHVLKNIPENQFLPLISVAFLIFLVALLTRMMIIFYYKSYTQKRIIRFSNRFSNMDEKKTQQLDKRFGKGGSFKERLEYYKSLLLTNKEAFVIGWSGMRGIVSLAAALGLPLLIADGSSFPKRDTLIFLTVTVVIIMLIIQGMGLPSIVKKLKFREK